MHISASSAKCRCSKSDLPYLSSTTASLRRRISTRKLPLPHAGSRKRESIRSVSPLTRSSIASTIHGGVKTSPWLATRFFDLIALMGDDFGVYLVAVPQRVRQGVLGGRRARQTLPRPA